MRNHTKSKLTISRLILGVAVTSLITGCTTALSIMPENPPPEMVVPELWSTEHNSTVESINNSWFGELNSPPLENLINEALQHNQEIQIANLTWRAAEQNALITGTNTNLKSELGVSGKRVQTLSSTNKKVFTTRLTL